jgi:hypothetical protein
MTIVDYSRGAVSRFKSYFVLNGSSQYEQTWAYKDSVMTDNVVRELLPSCITGSVGQHSVTLQIPLCLERFNEQA